MFEKFKKKIEINTPVNGNIIEITEVNDPVFNQKMMGEGFAVIPSDGNIYSPIEGTVKSIFPTQHALTLESKNGLDILIHIGLETVELEGKGFRAIVREGQKVTKNELLMEVDLSVLAENDKDNVVIVVFPELNSKNIIVNTNKKLVGEVAAVLK